MMLLLSETRRVGYTACWAETPKMSFFAQKTLYFTIFRPETTVLPSLDGISVKILIVATFSCQFFQWQRHCCLQIVPLYKLFYSIGLCYMHRCSLSQFGLFFCP